MEVPVRRRLLLISLLVVNLATPALSQESSNAEPIAAARDLLAGIERDVAALEHLETEPKPAGSEEQALLELRRARASEDLLARINEFVGAVIELQQEGSGVPELQEAAPSSRSPRLDSLWGRCSRG
jgi:hypothetical protein